MKKRLLGTAAIGALLLPAGTAFAADAIIIPAVTPVVVVVEDPGPVVTVTIEQTVARDLENDDWIIGTGIDVDVARPNAVSFLLSLFNETTIDPPASHEPGFRFTIYRELSNLTVSAFAGMAFEIPAATRTWEVGFGVGTTLGPADIGIEVRREQEIGSPPVYVVEAAADIAVGEVLTITPGIAVEFDTAVGPPPTTTVSLAAALALGPVTIAAGIEQELGGGDRTLTGEVGFDVTDRFNIFAGVERVNTDGPTIYGGFKLTLGGA